MNVCAFDHIFLLFRNILIFVIRSAFVDFIVEVLDNTFDAAFNFIILQRILREQAENIQNVLFIARIMRRNGLTPVYEHVQILGSFPHHKVGNRVSCGWALGFLFIDELVDLANELWYILK